VHGAAKVVSGGELAVVGLRSAGADQAEPPAPSRQLGGLEERVGIGADRLAIAPVDAVGEVQAQRPAPEVDRLRAVTFSEALTV
jgi:hypothetical protein